MALRSISLHLTGVALLGLSGLLSAPSAQAQGAQPARALGDAVLPEIIVSARRREETLQEVPAAVTVHDREVLERYGINDLSSMAQITPHLTINAAGSNAGASLFMRGIGSGTNLGFDQTVGVMVDDVFYNRGRWVQQAFMDMQRVEVLKGPQALYFGKNTPAGVVIITTADPSDEFEGYLRAGHEFNAQEWVVEGAMSLPITDTLGARVALRRTDMRGWMKNVAGTQVGVDPLGFTIPAPKNDYNESEEYTGRLTLKWTPNDELDVTLKLQGTRLKNAGQNTMTQKIGCQGPGNTPQLVFGVPDPFDTCSRNFKISKTDSPQERALDAPFDFNDGVPFTDYRSWNSALRLNYRHGDLLFTSVTGWNDYDNESMDNQDYSAAGQIWAGEREQHEAVTQEVRLASDYEGPLNFMVGAFYQRTDLDYRIQADVAPVPGDPVTGSLFSWDRPSFQKGKSWSAFAGLSWDITPELELAGGGRYSEERKNSRTQHTFVHGFLAGVFTPELFEDRFKDTNFSPEVTLSWQARDNLNLYGAYKTGFKAGGFSHTVVLTQGITLDEMTFDSEEAEGFEFGAKGTFLDGRLAANAALYRYDFKDQQVSVFNPDTTSFTIQNAARTRTQGIELDVRFMAREDLQLRMDVAYNRARFRDFIGPCFAGQTVEEGCNEAINPNTGRFTSQDLSGKRPQLAPDWNLAAGFTWDREFLRGTRIALNGDLRYASSYPLVVEQRADMFQGSYTTIDAGLAVYDASERWQLALRGRNLTNEVILLTGSGRPLTGGPAGLPAADPASGVRADGFAVTQRGRRVELALNYSF